MIEKGAKSLVEGRWENGKNVVLVLISDAEKTEEGVRCKKES